MKKLINNARYSKSESKRLSSDVAEVYKPDQAWSYSHHPSITYFQDNLYVIWSNGRVNEDDLGQRVMISVSQDFNHWSEPKPLVDSLMGTNSELVLTAAGFHQHDSVLTAYYGQYEYCSNNVKDGSFIEIGKDHFGTSLYAVATTDGQNWSRHMSMNTPIVPNHGPQKTKSGRLIISGNISFPYTDDATGQSGWQMSGIYPDSMKSFIYDDSESFWKVQQEMHWPCGLCEGSFYQTDDGVIHMLLRSSKGKSSNLWVTESSNDGETWSDPSETDFTNNSTKFHFGRLQDGRFYCVGSPDPHGRRCPLVLSISDDGVSFDEHFILAEKEYDQRIPGLHKGGVYGYPHTIILDDYLYTVCSICKEDVVVFRTKIKELQSL